MLSNYQERGFAMKRKVKIPEGKGEHDMFTGPDGQTTYQVQGGVARPVGDPNRGRVFPPLKRGRELDDRAVLPN